MASTASTATGRDIKAGTIVEDCRGRRFRVLALLEVFGIPAADMVLLRKDGAEDHRSFKVHNLPLSVLEIAR